MVTSKDKIGVFDSGMGGLTVLREIEKCLPHEKIIYFADSKNCPYGDKTSEEILQNTRNSVLKLIELGAKLIVVACNTATSSAIRVLREEFSDVVFVAIEPAVKPATEITKTGNVAVIATQYTINGRSLKELCARYSGVANILTIATPELVAIVENNKENTDESFKILKKYFSKIIDTNIDTVVLGCTHYAFLKKDIETITAHHDIQIIDAAMAVAKQVVKVLKNKCMCADEQSEGSVAFYSSLDEDYNRKLEKKYLEYKNLWHE
ncbi:MAG: glutamate racemase [Rikenellaceae bacterium]